MPERFFRKKKSFNMSPRCMVFACRHIVEDNEPVLYVKHDNAGDWQFLCGKNHSTEDGRVIALKEALRLDPSLHNVCNLECGETAVRECKDGEWEFL